MEQGDNFSVGWGTSARPPQRRCSGRAGARVGWCSVTLRSLQPGAPLGEYWPRHWDQSGSPSLVLGGPKRREMDANSEMPSAGTPVPAPAASVELFKSQR